MQELEYENIYKFLVSLGIVLIVLPLVVVLFTYNDNPILISQNEYAELSDMSLKMIARHESLINSVIKYLPWISLVSIIIGICSLIFGLIKWWKIQRILDNKLETESYIQALTLQQMNDKEIEHKIEKEVKESINKPSKPNEDNSVSLKQMVHSYSVIENLCFSYYSNKFSKNYTFKPNILVGKHEIDFVGVSKRTNIDLIFEIKYWVNYNNFIKKRLEDMSKLLLETAKEYEIIQQRRCKLYAVIITMAGELPLLENAVNDFKRYNTELSSKINLYVLSEDELKRNTTS